VKKAPPIEIGRITRPHGVAGEVRVALHWSESDALLRAEQVLLRLASGQERSFRIAAARATAKGFLLKVVGVADRDAAEPLRGAQVLVDRAVLPPLEEGEHYLCDLVGLRVLTPEGVFGEVIDVRSHPTLDTVLIRRQDGAVVEQVMGEPWVERVDVDAGEMHLASTDGLIEA